MDSVDTLLTQTDWSEFDHAYGPASDAPFHLLALLGDDSQARSAAVGYLDSAVLHQGTIYSATAPVARVVAAMLDDPRTAEPVENVLPWDTAVRPLRLDLVGFLTRVAESCMFDAMDDAALKAEAHPVGRSEADMERIRAETRAWLRDVTDDDPSPPPHKPPVAMLDHDFQQAMHARTMLACRSTAPELLDALTAVFDDPDDRIRVKALEGAVRLSGHQDLVAAQAMLAERLESTATSCSDPRTRAAAARLIGMLGLRPLSLLLDAHLGVRACAALAPELADDPRATRAILDALLTPLDADHWFEGHLPGQKGWLRFELIWAAVERVDDFEELLPAALAALPLAGIFTLDKDLGTFLTAAFPHLHQDGDSLSPAQRAYLSALIDREDLWRAASTRPWFRRTGLPHERDACRALVDA